MMMMLSRTLPVLLLCFGLAACGTPQEQCIAANTRELRTVERLIAETQGNLARGYALEEVTVSTVEWDECSYIVPGKGKKGKPVIKTRMCLEDEDVTVTRPRTIDPAAEARTLAGLQAKRATLARAAAAAVATCKAQYPE
jgi:hypothetical protein